MCVVLRLLREQRGRLSFSRANTNRCLKKLCELSATRNRARRNAVEFSILAGFPLCCPCSDGGQRRNIETCIQCAGVCVSDRRGFPACRISGRFVPHPPHRQRTGCRGNRKSTCKGGYADRQHSRGKSSGIESRIGFKKDGP